MRCTIESFMVTLGVIEDVKLVATIAFLDIKTSHPAMTQVDL